MHHDPLTPRRIALPTCLLALASLATACQFGDGKASEMPVPKTYTSAVFDHVTYPDGIPDGKYDNDPRVRTVYTYEAELAWARAHYDWTSPQLTQVAWSESIPSEAWDQVFDVRDKEYDQITPAGPRPLTVLSLTVKKKGGAEIVVCRANNWYITQGDVVPDATSIQGNYADYTVSISHDGYAYILGDLNYSDKPCDISKARLSYFDPLPRYAEPAESDIKLTNAILAYLNKPTSTDAP